MTGAPKKRSVQLLCKLENLSRECLVSQNIPSNMHLRGIYSGSIGYLSSNGCLKMNVAIRTAVLKPLQNTPATFEVLAGTGGAITYLSNNRDEWQEVLLKICKL